MTRWNPMQDPTKYTALLSRAPTHRFFAFWYRRPDCVIWWWASGAACQSDSRTAITAVPQVARRHPNREEEAV